MSFGIIEIDVHGLNTEQAIREVAKKVSSAKASDYTVRVIHGYNGGTRIKSALRDEFGYGRETKVLRIKDGDNQGITELVLRELW